MAPTAAVVILISQSIFDFVIVIFIMFKMSEIINNQKKAEKDINELWKFARLFRSMVYGRHNRLVAKMQSILKKEEINSDFSDVFLKDE